MPKENKPEGLMIECPVECSHCGLIFDGAGWRDCPKCHIRSLKENVAALRLNIAQAIAFLQDDAPLHALEALRTKL